MKRKRNLNAEMQQKRDKDVREEQTELLLDILSERRERKARAAVLLVVLKYLKPGLTPEKPNRRMAPKSEKRVRSKEQVRTSNRISAMKCWIRRRNAAAKKGGLQCTGNA